MKKIHTKKLPLSIQTVVVLEPAALTPIAGARTLFVTCACVVPTQVTCPIPVTK